MHVFTQVGGVSDSFHRIKWSIQEDSWREMLCGRGFLLQQSLDTLSTGFFANCYNNIIWIVASYTNTYAHVQTRTTSNNLSWEITTSRTAESLNRTRTHTHARTNTHTHTFVRVNKPNDSWWWNFGNDKTIFQLETKNMSMYTMNVVSYSFDIYTL